MIVFLLFCGWIIHTYIYMFSLFIHPLIICFYHLSIPMNMGMQCKTQHDISLCKDTDSISFWYIPFIKISGPRLHETHILHVRVFLSYCEPLIIITPRATKDSNLIRASPGSVSHQQWSPASCQFIPLKLFPYSELKTAVLSWPSLDPNSAFSKPLPFCWSDGAA